MKPIKCHFPYSLKQISVIQLQFSITKATLSCILTAGESLCFLATLIIKSKLKKNQKVHNFADL